MFYVDRSARRKEARRKERQVGKPGRQRKSDDQRKSDEVKVHVTFYVGLYMAPVELLRSTAAQEERLPAEAHPADTRPARVRGVPLLACIAATCAGKSLTALSFGRPSRFVQSLDVQETGG